MLSRVHFSSDNSEWTTPQELFNNLDDIFTFDLDAAATAENSKCTLWLGPGSPIAEDAFSIDWKGTLFLNPPYGRSIKKWIEKAYMSSIENDATVVCLLPARPDTAWFQTCWKAPFICFIKGRLKFGNSEAPAPFPSCIVIFSKNLENNMDVSFLSGEGAVVRTIWPYNPIDRIRYDWLRDHKEQVQEYLAHIAKAEKETL